MTTNEPQKTEGGKRRSGLVGGLILIGIGILLLLQNVFASRNFGMYVPLLLGLVFIAAAFLASRRGFLIPGGILTGIGAGVLIAQRLDGFADGNRQGGFFLLCFAAGWVLISLLSLVLKDPEGPAWMRWPLIPGGILGLIGGLLLLGTSGLRWLSYIQQGWPVLLILAGLYLLYKWIK
jgi:hypothetical protein